MKWLWLSACVASAATGASTLTASGVLGLTTAPAGDEREREADLDRTLDQLDQQLDHTEARIDQAHADVQHIETRARLIIAQFDRARATFEAATLELDRAGVLEESAASDFAIAAEAYETAAERYRWTAYAVIALAATAAAGKFVCSGRMSTAQFRRANGITDPQRHVDHIWPAARGGADHPANYQVWPAARNMSCGQGCLAQKLAERPLQFVVALAVSVLARLGCG